MDWEDAFNKLKTVIDAYEEIGPAGAFGLFHLYGLKARYLALFHLYGLKARYLAGDRTEDLYESIMEAYETC